MDEPSWLEKTRGYIDLGMFKEALNEIERLPPKLRANPEVQEMRIIIELDRENYNQALALCEVLIEFQPERHAGFIQGAYCLHAMQRTEDAIEHLQSGPVTLQEESVYFYNLACYEVALGKNQAAYSWLQHAIEMEPAARRRALEDQDLEPLHHLIKKPKN